MHTRRRQPNIAPALRREECCPRPDKMPYPSEGVAKLALWRIVTSPTRTLIHPDRCYLCPCGAWHLTHSDDHTPKD